MVCIVSVLHVLPPVHGTVYCTGRVGYRRSNFLGEDDSRNITLTIYIN